MSQTQEITTHVPRGGKLYPYHEVSTQSLDQQLTYITQTSGTVLSKHLGFIGEFSMDLGENEEGAFYLSMKSIPNRCNLMKPILKRIGFSN